MVGQFSDMAVEGQALSALVMIHVPFTVSPCDRWQQQELHVQMH